MLQLNLVTKEHEIIVTGDVPAGHLAYMDGAGLKSESVNVCILPTGSDAVTRAYSLLSNTAKIILDKIGEEDRVYVNGIGLFRNLLLGNLSADRIVESDAATVFIETTGEKLVIENIITNANRLSTVFLCVHPGNQKIMVDLYASIHALGLNVIALDMWHQRNFAPNVPLADYVDSEECRPKSIEIGEKIPPDCLWLEIKPKGSH